MKQGVWDNAVEEAAFLLDGDQCIINGLVNAPQYNGCMATINSWNARTGRFVVSIASATGVVDRVAVKTINLLPMALVVDEESTPAKRQCCSPGGDDWGENRGD